MAKQWWARAVVGRTSVSDPLQDHEPPDAAFEAEWRPNVKTRLLVVLGVLAVWAVGVEARLVYLQVYSHEDYAAEGAQQQRNVFEPEAPRGDILDRNGQLLAYTVQSIDVFADPSLLKSTRSGRPRPSWKSPPMLARGLCHALDAIARTKNWPRSPRSCSDPPASHDPRRAKAMSPTPRSGLRAWLDAATKLKPKPAAGRSSSETRDRATTRRWIWRRTSVGFVGCERQRRRRHRSALRRRHSRRARHGVRATWTATTNEMFTRRGERAGARRHARAHDRCRHPAHSSSRRCARASRPAARPAAPSIVMRSETGEILAHAELPDVQPERLLAVVRRGRDATAPSQDATSPARRSRS